MAEQSPVLVTGATSGLGRAVASSLAAQGWSLLVHGRDPAKVSALADELGATGFVADLQSLAEVRRLAGEVRAATSSLGVLVNNAGIGFGAPGAGREESPDGHELRLAVNYLAPVLLTRELLPLLEASAPARVVNVASLGQQPLNLDDVEFRHGYTGTDAYRRAKLAMIAWTFDLAGHTRDAGVTVNALHPGTFMPTAMVVEAGIESVDSVESGAAAVERLVADPALDDVTGEFFDGLEAGQALEQAYHPEFQVQLRETTDRLLAG